MTATNINIDEFIKVLNALRERGHKLIDLDMLPDESHPSMNKLVIHPVYNQGQGQLPPPGYQHQSPSEIRNPDISTENNDIFGYFGL